MHAARTPPFCLPSRDTRILTSTAYPARLHVLLARKARVGLVFRRGPSKSVCTLLWNLDTDVFELGRWFKGRIYERRADLSPDGRHLIYFASKQGRRDMLRKRAHGQVGPPEGKGCYWDEHQIVRPSNGTLRPCPDWERADLDGRSLLWAQGGSRFADGDVKDSVLVKDLNGMRFEPRTAPY